MSKENKKKENPLKTWAIFSTLGIQMGATIYGMSWLGGILDEKYHTDKLFTALGVILAVAGSTYLVIVQLKRINKKDQK
ncbi:MAG: AtpZ/AtpI family protein [Leeuwenhoekiella sp.]